MPGPVTIAVVDDDPLVRGALISYLQGDDGLRLVHECSDGAQAVATLLAEPVDVVIMDVRMPRLDGIEATRRLREELPDIKILVITSFDEGTAVRAALAAGANGFLLKDTSPAGLRNAIRTVMEGSSVISPGPVTQLVLQERAQARRDPVDVGLSRREHEILQLLCAAYSNTEIAAELVLSESTVKSHVSAIMTKMGVASRLKAVVRAHELGLVDPT